MVNFNGNLVSTEDTGLSFFNRGFSYGDAVFETLKAVDGRVIFWEDHYFRLMASMRLLRMNIPLTYTPEYFSNEFKRLIQAQPSTSSTWRIRLTVFRNSTGFYTPLHNEVAFVLHCELLTEANYPQQKEKYVVDLFKDHYVQPALLSNLKTNNKILNVLGSIFAKENDLDNCILINDKKEVVEALQSNIFLLFDNELHTPPLSSGCLDGIVRKQLIRLSKELGLEVKERGITPFELQKANEIWLTSTIGGIQGVTNYRRKEYKVDKIKQALALLNTQL